MVVIFYVKQKSILLAESKQDKVHPMFEEIIEKYVIIVENVKVSYQRIRKMWQS